ncbi:MAG TPA: hypothetical protein VEQ10_21725, partial [Vicinamibacteria bacterium]|nr:hypothetical protein [Vicinamibacteria bacterium]
VTAPAPSLQPAPTPPTGAELPSYPLGPLAVPDFLAPGHPFTLTDLDFHLQDTVRTDQAFTARVKFKDLGYLRADFEGETRGLTLTTHRLEVSAFDTNGSWDLTADYRGRRFVASGVVRRLGSDSGRLVEGSLDFRLTREVELQTFVVGDSSRPDERFLREAALGVFWQHGSALETGAQFERSYESTLAGENRHDLSSGSVIAQLGAAELSGFGSYEDVQGRFPRRLGEASGQARWSVAPKLLLEAQADGNFEAGAGTRSHLYRGALTWFGRRFTLPRAGELARRSLALSREAFRRGEYEFASFDVDGLRAQRERLGLSPQKQALVSDMEAGYRAEVAERPLPLAGVEVRQTDDALADVRGWSVLAFLGMPWPPALPWRASEGSVPFLRLDLMHSQSVSATDFRADENTARLTVSLNREMDLLLRFTRTEPSALDIIRGIGERSTFEVSWVYARGR